MALSVLVGLLAPLGDLQSSQEVAFSPAVYTVSALASRLSSADRIIRPESDIAERAAYLSLKARPRPEYQEILKQGLGLEIAKVEGSANQYVLREVAKVRAERVELQTRLSRTLLGDLTRCLMEGAQKDFVTQDFQFWCVARQHCRGGGLRL
jgi:hypothetical protein